MTALDKALDKFLTRNPHILIPEKVWGECLETSRALRDCLRQHKIACHLLRCDINRIPRPRIWKMLDWMEDWHDWEHFVVCLKDGTAVFDPTAKQLDYTHPPIRRMTLGELQREWLYYHKDK
jgi:hypothetical protein